MPSVRCNGIEIEYEVRGDPAGRPLLLVMGLGCQLVHWEDDFCDLLVARGHRVIRFDNRDTGRSTWFEEAGVPDLARVAAGDAGAAPYRLEDMADDAAGLLDALGVDSVHAAGASMGGMIVQCLAIRHPSRVRSLTSIMSSTGRPGLPTGRPEAVAALMTEAPAEIEALVEHNVGIGRMLNGTGFAFDEERQRRRTRRAFARGHNPTGAQRQVAAIVASPPRHERLAALDLPALVIHGDEDPLVVAECGVDTHRCLRGSDLLMIEGMGHDLPAGAWPPIVDAIAALTEKHAGSDRAR